MLDNDLIASVWFENILLCLKPEIMSSCFAFGELFGTSGPIISAEKCPSTERRLLIHVVEKTDFFKFSELRF